ncbi:MAG: hypothetical protein ACWGO1_15840, partial [Anaerolineales bacterium]
MKALNSTQSAFTIGAIAWAAFSLLALAGMIAVSPVRGYDPGGGFGLLSSILMAAWGLLVGAYSLRW